MGKKGGGDKHPLVGYGYGMNFTYAFCESMDYCSGYKMTGDQLWSGKVTGTSSNSMIKAPTGKFGDVYKSDFPGNSALRVVNGVPENWGGSLPGTVCSGKKYPGVVTIDFCGNYTKPPKKYDMNQYWTMCYGLGDGFYYPGCMDYLKTPSRVQYGATTFKYFDKSTLKEKVELPVKGTENIKEKSLLKFFKKHTTTKQEGTRKLAKDSLKDTKDDDSILNCGNAAFIGDNTTTVPKYEFRFTRQYFNTVVDSGYLKVDKYGANPAGIIADILQNALDIPADKLDSASFNYAAQILYNENLGMSFILTKGKKALKWIEEILRYADGCLYFDFAKQQYVLKLFRADYDIDSLPIITEDNVNKLTIKQGSWQDVVSTFIFKYSNAHSGKQDTYIIDNRSIVNSGQVIVSKTFDFNLVNSFNCMGGIIDRTIKKNGTPANLAKFRVNILIGNTLRPGDCIKLQSPITNTIEIYRITKIGGDSPEQPYLDIEAITDIYNQGYSAIAPEEELPDIVEKTFELDYPRIAISGRLPPEYAATDKMHERAYTVLCAAKHGTDIISNVVITNTDCLSISGRRARPWKAAKILASCKPDGLTNLAEVGYNRDFVIYLDNSDGYLQSGLILPDSEWQQGKILLATGRDEYPLFYARSIEVIDYDEDNDDYTNSKIKITGIFNPFFEEGKDSKYTGPTDGYHSVTWDLSEVDGYVFFTTSKSGFIGSDEVVYFTNFSERCFDENGDTRKLHFIMTNNYTNSPEIEQDLVDCNVYTVPPRPQNIKAIENEDGSVTLKWGAAHYYYGNSKYKADDIWSGVEGEGINYGRFVICKANSNGELVSPGNGRLVSQVSADGNGEFTYTLSSDDIDNSKHWAIVAWANEEGGTISDGSYTRIDISSYEVIHFE